MEYSYNLSDVDEVTKDITITIPAETVSARLKQEYNEIAKTASIKGFRKGKAPKQMIEKLYGARVNLELARKLVTESLDEIVHKEKLQSVGQPELDFGQPEEGKEFTFTAKISLFPSPHIAGYQDVSIEIDKSQVSDEDVDRVIHSLLDSRATISPVEDRTIVEEGDVIDAQLTVTLEGEQEGQQEPLVVGLGEKKLPPELEEGIIGMSIGESKEIQGAIPDSHKNEELQGKSATYTVQLKALSTKVIPELNDELVKQLGLDVESVLELRLKVRENLEKEKEGEDKAQSQAKILEVILEKNDFLIPQALIDDEIRHMLIKYGAVDPKKVDVSNISVESFREKLGEEASKRVRTAVVVDRIAEQEKLSATEEDINTALKDIATKNGISVDEVKQYFTSQDQAVSFTIEQTRNKVLDYLVTKSNVTVKAA